MGLHLSRTDTIFGWPAVPGRDLIIHIGHTGSTFDIDDMRSALETSYRKARGEKCPSNGDAFKARREAPRLLSRLVAEGYVEPDKEDLQTAAGSWKLTKKGAALARVKFVKRMTRAKAVAELQGFIERVEHINSAAAEYVYTIENAWLYGSLITDAIDIGDVDLIYQTEARRGHCGHKNIVNHSRARAKASGRSLDYRGQLNYGDNEIERILKDRRPVVSLNAYVYQQLAQIEGGYLQIVRDGLVLEDVIEQIKAR